GNRIVEHLRVDLEVGDAAANAEQVTEVDARRPEDRFARVARFFGLELLDLDTLEIAFMDRAARVAIAEFSEHRRLVLRNVLRELVRERRLRDLEIRRLDLKRDRPLRVDARQLRRGERVACNLETE